ncbi:MAG TPA: endonuclease/exonuclease/phosphatase family protein, partial [Bryobacteraceae bacterium]
LQEASLWRTGPSPDRATVPLFDQIGLLQAALNAAGTPYDLVAVNVLSDMALSGTLVPALRLTDRNALLIRSDLRPPAFHLSDVHAKTYSTTFPFGQFQISAGWIAATVHTGNQHFRLIATHLQSPIAGVPEATLVQVAQAQELIHELRNVTVPVVLCGDFNSDATHGGSTDDTPTVDVIQAAGYPEVWPLLHPPSDPGMTWPMYLEDRFPPAPFFAPSRPYERIDLFFQQGMQLISIDRVVAPAPSLSTPPFGSDHAGVIAVFRP